MMDFSKMKMTHEQIGEDMYRLKVGKDYIEVFCNIEHLRFPSDLQVILHRHYIGTVDNTPTNPRRTVILLSVVKDYFNRMYLKDLEAEIKDIAKLPATNRLEESWLGKRFYFVKGTSAFDVYSELFKIYDAYESGVTSAKSFYDISLELNQTPDDGFLSEAIRDSLL